MKSTNFLISSALLFVACTNDNDSLMEQQDTIQPPMAEKVAFEMTEHGNTRIDDYFWMRLSDEQKEATTPDEQTQKVLDYLNAENEYLEAKMAPHKALREQLFEEIVGRIEQKDESVPVTKNGYSYYSTFDEGDDYPRYFRKNLESDEVQLLLDGPEMGKGLSYFAVGGQTVSPDNALMVYGVDTVSRRQYVLHFKDITTGEMLSDKIINTTGYAVWANDNKTVFYTRQDEVTLRSYRIYKHVIGTPSESDELVYEEKDETFSCYVSKSKSDEYLFIESSQTLSSEVRYISANDVNGTWKVVQPRERNLEYSVSHFGDHFYIITNLEARNFRLMKTPVNKTSKENWEEIIAHRSATFLEGIEIFKDFYVLEERTNGLTNLRIKSWNNNDEHYIEFNDPAYMAYTSSNPEYNTDVVRFGYTSLTTPNSVFDYNMKTRERELLKQTKVLDDNFSPDNYVSERHYATARDGVKVPISLVYKKGMELNENNPVLLYGYGSYGNSIDPYFSSVRLSLLDRGFVFAIAHIRGGQELGREWYEDGKLLKKKNTFYDFIDCGEYLIEKGFTKPAHLYAQGGSAGGLLMGAVMNMRPDLWNGVIAGVPFVDVISTMWDETIPLTTGEFDEWGNPKDKEYYDYMLSYSPYDNIEKKDYPNTLITTGYWDSQVQYWEPAKWIAKLRANKTDDNLLMMYCNMDVGHGGASGRFERYKEVALEYAFLLSLEGIEE
ncbi:MAG: S9 family peptidase [Crocinitomicaceae bacterium]|nr:S9 family peptidase [Crocinitomicaceae bacterium]